MFGPLARWPRDPFSIDGACIAMPVAPSTDPDAHATALLAKDRALASDGLTDVRPLGPGGPCDLSRSTGHSWLCRWHRTSTLRSSVTYTATAALPGLPRGTWLKAHAGLRPLSPIFSDIYSPASSAYRANPEVCIYIHIYVSPQNLTICRPGPSDDLRPALGRHRALPGTRVRLWVFDLKLGSCGTAGAVLGRSVPQRRLQVPDLR